ncbi:MAG: Hsp33 family molecular chaperone HslO, partial [Dokdonella sp.]
ERVEDMLRSLGRAESDATLAEQGSIEVTCEFCDRRYVLDEADVEAVFASAPAEQPAATRH